MAERPRLRAEAREIQEQDTVGLPETVDLTTPHARVEREPVEHDERRAGTLRGFDRAYRHHLSRFAL